MCITNNNTISMKINNFSFWGYVYSLENRYIIFSLIFREQLRLGVVRDKENQERRKRENIYILNKQQTLTEELRKAEAEKDKLIN